jgi:hypothetical protein
MAGMHDELRALLGAAAQRAALAGDARARAS